jgi:tol-pal system protein YbgF
MHTRIAAAFVVALAGGCATAGAPAANAPPARDSATRDEWERRSGEQTARIGELEARVALLEQEARLSRNAGPAKPTEPVRIGRHVRDAAPESTLAAAEGGSEPEPEDASVATLRLVGGTPEWTVPVGMPDRLPVAPLPAVAAAPDAAESVASREEAATRERYRAALKLVRERAFGAALQALTSFLAEHPDGAFTDDAMYWRAEVHYAERRYQEALDQFAAVVARYPTGTRVPDALLKLGMCHRRLGDEANARAYFRKVRDQYPDTEAARLVPEEGST